MTNIYVDNFDSDTVGSIAPGWTAKAGTWAVGTVSPVSSPNSFGSTSTADGDAAIYTGTTAVADMSSYFEQVLHSVVGTYSPFVGSILRSDSAYSNCYIALAQTNSSGTINLFLYKKVAGSVSQVSGSTTVSGFTAGQAISFRTQIQGSVISAKVWATAGTEPSSFQMSWTDTSISAAGYPGLYNGENGGSGTAIAVDNFALSNPSTSSVVISPNNSAIAYSPGNWSVSSTQALTVNAGAYLSAFFSGSSVVLGFNAANIGSPASEIYYRIDGYEAGSPWTKASVAATITPAMPSDTASFPYHLLEVVVKSTSETLNRWNSPSATAVIFTGLTLASGGTVVAPGIAPNGSVLFFGDSITEGVRTVNQTATNDTDRNDAMMGWAYAQRKLLGVEGGVIGFGGSGLTVTGNGNVPALQTSLQSIMAGVARSTAVPNLKLIVLNEGTNDSGATAGAVSAGLTAALNELIANYPGVAIAVLRPFNGSQASALQAGIAACSNPSLVHWVDTTGFFNTAYGADSLNLHPSGPNNLGVIAPKVAAALQPLLNPSSGSGRSYSFS